jgi:hypothetical protein
MAKKNEVNMVQEEIVLSLTVNDAGLVVYRITPNSGLFWRNMKNPQGFGPFINLEAVMRSYANYCQDAKDLRQSADNIIKVDFVAKKRIG